MLLYGNNIAHDPVAGQRECPARNRHRQRTYRSTSISRDASHPHSPALRTGGRLRPIRTGGSSTARTARNTAICSGRAFLVKRGNTGAGQLSRQQHRSSVFAGHTRIHGPSGTGSAPRIHAGRVYPCRVGRHAGVLAGGQDFPALALRASFSERGSMSRPITRCSRLYSTNVMAEINMPLNSVNPPAPKII